MTWQQQRQLVYNSIETLNSFKNRPTSNEVFTIKFSGANPQWKTIYLGASNISESFRTWKEVSIFLSGMRTMANVSRNNN